MTEKKAYRTTELAGYFVAGQRVPSVQDGDGNRQPKVGHILHLTEAEAKYELLQRAIEPADAPMVAAPLSPPPPAPAKGRVSRPVEDEA